MKKGYTKAWRKELDSEIWLMPPLYLKVWYWLRHKVQHDPFLFPTHKGIGVWVLPGQRLTSLQEIAEGVKWSEWGKEIIPNKKTIKTVLDWMVDEGMVTIESNAKGTLISIINWDTYNHVDVVESNAKGTRSGSRSERGLDTRKECKECKECKEVKEEGVIESTPGDKSPPPSALKDLWNEVVKTPFVKEFTKARAIKCRLRMNERTLEEWRQVFQKVKDSPFCQGDNDRGWRADFDWITKNQENSARVLEGKYEKKHFNGTIQASKGAAGGLARIAEMQRDKLEREARENV